MAKKKSKKAVNVVKSLQDADLKHYRNTEQYASMVGKLFDQAIDDLGNFAKQIGLVGIGDTFSFDLNKGIAKQVEDCINLLAGRVTALVQSGNRKEWSAACDKSDEFVKNVMNTSSLTQKTLQSYQERNLEALNAFQERKVNGLNLSERVWNTVAQLKTEAELAVDTIGNPKKKAFHPAIDAKMQQTKFDRALGTGMSAAEFSREIRSCLKEPNKLFRRVRDKYGNLQLSKAAQLYHPGQGVYRSSYKNAMRMTRSEINMAYRQSDKMRWDQLDFVVGYKVELSNNHTCLGSDGKPHPFHDICDVLAGDYPKTFKFVGWHPQCRCHAVPILQDRKEMMEQRKHLDEPGYKQLPASNEVKDVPENFKKYIKDNYDRINGLNGWKGWQSKPYYYTDNEQWIDKTMNPDKYKVVALDLDQDTFKQLSDYEMYSYNHQGSKLFAQALQNAKDAILKGDKDAFDAAMADMAARMAKNEASTASKAKKKGESPIIDINVLRQKKLNEDLKQFTEAQIKNLEELEKAIGQKRGLSMSYSDANTGKENPKYQEYLQTHKYIKVVTSDGYTHYEENPEYKKMKGYAVNCQTCTLVHEMRRRGFNVEAISNYRRKVWDIYKKQGVGSEKQGYRIGKWLDQDGNPADYYYAHQWAADNKKGKLVTKADIMAYFEDVTKEDGRYEICVDWKSKSAHVFCAERKNGKLVFFDPQSGEKDVIDGYIAKARIHTFGVIRTDNKLINPKLAATFIPDGEIPIEVGVSMSQEEMRKQKIKEAAEKRHSKRTPEKVMELTKFAEEHKKKTEQIYEAVKELADKSKKIKESDKKDIEKLVNMSLGKEGVKMKDGRIAGMSLEKLMEQANKLKPTIADYDKAVSAGNNIQSILKGIKDVDMKDMQKAMKSGSIKEIKAATDTLLNTKKKIESYTNLANPLEVAKKTSMADAENANKAVGDMFKKVSGKSLQEQKDTLEYEAKWVAGHKKYSTWEAVSDAYNAKAKELRIEIEWNKRIQKYFLLVGSNASIMPDYADKLAKLDDVINTKSSLKVADSLISDLEDINTKFKTILDSLDEISKYLKSHPSSKIQVLYDESQVLLKKGDVKGVQDKITQMLVIKKKNEASAASHAKASEAKKKEKEFWKTAQKALAEIAKSGEQAAHDELELAITNQDKATAEDLIKKYAPKLMSGPVNPDYTENFTVHDQTSYENAMKALGQATKDAWTNATHEERAAFRDYSGSYSGSINRDAAAGRPNERVDRIDKVMSGISTVENMVVRSGQNYCMGGYIFGMDFQKLLQNGNLDELNKLAGAEGVNKGFMSSSFNAEGGFSKDFEFQLFVPKGSSIMNLNEVSVCGECRDIDDWNGEDFNPRWRSDGETEIFFKKGAKFRFVKAEKGVSHRVIDSDYITIFIEVLGFE